MQTRPVYVSTMPRRRLLSLVGLAVPAGFALTAMPAQAGMEGDIAILNTALALEHQGIAAYELGAASGLLKGDLLKTAVLFQSHHKDHRDALAATVQKLGGKPAEAKSLDQYAKDLNAASLKSATDVLKLAQRLEMGATNAYIGVIPSLADKGLQQVSAKLAADEALHWGILTSALAAPIPTKGFIFGA
jgi:rubrerythrin